MGRSARTMHIWPSAEAAERFVAKLKEQGSLRGWEQEFCKKSGELYVAQLSAQVLIVRGEQVVLSTLVDITERKRAEEALRASNAELARFNQAMVGRELRMIELKQEVNALCAQLGEAPHYAIGFEIADNPPPA